MSNYELTTTKKRGRRGKNEKPLRPLNNQTNETKPFLAMSVRRKSSYLSSHFDDSSPKSSSSVAILPVTFITSLASMHWRRSPKNRSRSSRTNWTITLNSSRSDSDATASCTVGCGSGVIGYLLDWSSIFARCWRSATFSDCRRSATCAWLSSLAHDPS